MADVYADGELIADALLEAKVADEKSRDEIQERIASVRQQQAGASRALDRYFAAFEQGIAVAFGLPGTHRHAKGAHRSLGGRERQLAREAPYEPSEAISAEEAAQWAQLLPDLLTAGSAQQRKALMRKLIKEIRVMSRDEIVPTYRIPPWFAQCQVRWSGSDSNPRPPACKVSPAEIRHLVRGAYLRGDQGFRLSMLGGVLHF